MAVNSQQHIPIIKVNASSGVITTDTLAVEEPLEIRLEYGTEPERQTQIYR